MLIPDDFTGGCIAVPKDMMRFSFLQGEKFMSEKMDYVYLVKIYDSIGRLLPVVTAFATRQGAEAYVHDFLPTGKYQEGAAACKAEIVKTEVRE